MNRTSMLSEIFVFNYMYTQFIEGKDILYVRIKLLILK